MKSSLEEMKQEYKKLVVKRRDLFMQVEKEVSPIKKYILKEEMMALDIIIGKVTQIIGTEVVGDIK